ncbi:MAG: type II toxin-antitoxin system VapC family toxin [Pseudonocardiaceae bacterium]
MIRCYVTDEPDHAELQGQILDGEVPVVTSELALVELSAAVHAAHRAGRVARPSDILNGIERDCGWGRPVALLRLQPDVVLPLARDLVSAHPLRSLDALHLAVARSPAAELAAGEPIVLVTRHHQAAAAAALGMAVE